MLYQPTISEIDYLLGRATDKWPILAERIAKARQLLLDASIDGGERWIVLGQSGTPYTVQLDPRSCACADFQSGRAPVVAGRDFCKHLIAVNAYTEILRQQLGKRLVGSSRERGTLQLLRQVPNTYLMRLDHGDTITNIERDAIRFVTRWSERGTTFASDADALTFARWLGQANPLPAPEPSYAQPTPITTTDAAWNRTQWQHYLATGEIPALVESRL